MLTCVQLGELFWLKSQLSLRKLQDHLKGKLPSHWLFLGVFLFCLPFVFIAAIVILWFHRQYRFEVIGVASFVYMAGWMLAPLAGGAASEFLDFRALWQFPVSRRLLFVASVGTSLMDPAVLPVYPMLWGSSIALSWLYGWHLLLPLFLVQLVFVFLCVSLSQVMQFLWFLVLRRLRWTSFIMGFLFPLSVFVLLLAAYGSLLWLIPFFDLFSRPEFLFLEHSKFLPSTMMALCLKAICTQNSAQIVVQGLSLFTFVLFFLLAGSVLVQYYQGDEEHYEKKVSQGSLGNKCESMILKVLGDKLGGLTIKEMKLYLREPHLKILIAFPILTGALGWVLTSLLYEMNTHSLGVLYVWPVFLYGALFVIASDATGNIFGLERGAFQLLMSLPAEGWRIFAAKNLSVVIPAGFVVSIVLIVGAVFGVHSIHSLHSIWLYFVLSLFLLFTQGNLLSVWFPYRLDSLGSKALQRNSFARQMILSLVRLVMAGFCTILAAPVFFLCVWPFTFKMGLYVKPFSVMSAPELKQALDMVMTYLPLHIIMLLYAFGVYGLSLYLAVKLFDKRKENIAQELCVSEEE